MQIFEYAQRYSMNILVSWQLTSIFLYKRLCDFFILPSLSKLHRLSRGITVEAKDLDLQYLKQHISNLTKNEHIVTLILGEVCTAQRIKYCNESFIGLTEDNFPAQQF